MTRTQLFMLQINKAGRFIKVEEWHSSLETAAKCLGKDVTAILDSASILILNSI